MNDSPETESPRRPPLDKTGRRRRLLRRALLGVVLGVVLVPSAAVVFLHTEAGGEALRGRLAARLSERTTGTPSIGHLSFSLTSGVRVTDVVLRQADGSEAVRVRHVLVRPVLGATLRGRPTFADLEVTGVRVVAAKKETGGTTLGDLFKPTISTPGVAPSKPREAAAYFRLARVAVGDVEFVLTGPDGSHLALSHVAVAGEVTARPRRKGVELALREIAGSVSVVRPDGSRIALDDLKTSLSATLVEGAGPFRLGDLSGAVVLTPVGREPVRTPIAFGAIEGTLSPGQLSIAAKTLSALFLSVGGVSLKGATKDGALAGPQAVQITGLRVDPETLAKITGRKVLAQPLAADVSAEGTPEALRLAGVLSSAGQWLSFAGTLDVRNPPQLAYDLGLETKDFSLPPLLATEAPPEVRLGMLELSVQGQGTKPDTAVADVRLTVQDLVVRGTPVDSIKLVARLESGRIVIKSLDVSALGQAVHAEGSYVLADKAVALEVRTAGSLQDSLAAARKLGLPVRSSPLLASLDLPDGARVSVEGHVGGSLRVTVPHVPVRVMGATARVDAVVELSPTPPGSEKKLEATAIDATLHLDGISPRALARSRGKDLDVAGGLSGTVRIQGSARSPVVTAALSGRLGAIGSEEVNVAISADVANGVAAAKASAKTLAGESLLALDARVPLPGRAPPGARVAVVLDVPRLAFTTLLPVLPPKARLALKGVRDGYLSAHIDVQGSARAPSGTVDVRVGGKILSDDPRELHVTGSLSPEPTGALAVALAATAESGLAGPSLSLRTDARFARSPLVDPKTPLAHHTVLGLEQDLERLPKSLPLPPGLAGTVRVAADLNGTRDDLLGTVTVAARGLRKQGTPALDVDLEATLRDADVALSGGLVVAGERLLELAGTVGLPGKGFVPALKEKAPRALALSVKVPDRSLASLGTLVPRLGGAPGSFGGALTVSGTTAVPEVQGSFAYRGYPTATGQEGRLGLDISAKKERAELRLIPGELGEIVVSLPLGELLAARQAEVPVVVPADIETRLSGDLASVLPRLRDDRTLRVQGAIESDLGAALSLSVSKSGAHLRSVKTAGSLAVSAGRVELPAVKRTFHGIALSLAGREEGLILERLGIHESDGEKPDRAIEGKGAFPLTSEGDKAALGIATLDLSARDFLLSGGNFGEHDAPRAALSGALAVKVDLSGDTRRIQVEATDLVLFSPDRQPRAHAQEVLSKGDVLDAKTVRPGSLGPPKAPPDEGPKPAAKAPSDGEKGLEVRVHVVRTRLYQAPIDLHVEGDILLERPAGQERALSGGLRIGSGRMLFGGRWLEVESGEIALTPAGPLLDVRFKKEAPVWALRDVATEGEGHDRFVRIRLVGVVGKQEAKPIGLGDSLFEALSVLNLGQVRTLTRPDLQASGSPQLPEVPQIRQTSFMAANLPHLAFLDHAGVRSDPADGRFSYGRLSRVEAERYLDGGARRWRVTTRPLVPGRSEGEVAHEWLFQNDKQVVSGVGVQGGTRLGGGPTVFWEWSSKE